MLRKTVSGIMLTLLLMGMLRLAFDVQMVKAEPRTWYVDDDGGADFTKIQDAINAANPGDTIYVHNGTYYEQVLLNKFLTLKGESRESTIIDGVGKTSVVEVTANHVNFCEFTIQNGMMGIRLDYNENNTISGNVITTNVHGMFIHQSKGNSIIDNTIINNIHNGIDLMLSGGNVLVNNNVIGNGQNFGVRGSSFSDFIQEIDTSNSVDGKPIYYLVNEQDRRISADAGYVAAVNSTKITVKDLDLTHNLQGVLFAWTTDSVIQDVTVSNSYDGISLIGGSSNTVSSNTAFNNTHGILCEISYANFFKGNCLTDNWSGISVRGSDNTISDNKIANNWRGIQLGEIGGNTIYHNNFINNTRQMYFYSNSSENKWDDGYPSGGNYWDDYSELDIDGDGIGDTPYVIDANNQDRYPLVVPLGPIPIVLDETIYPVELKSNSTISRFQSNASQKMISFNVTGPDGTLGFCNLTIPDSLVEDLWQGNYIVLVDKEEPITMNDWTDGTHTYIYFTYVHSTHEVTIMQEIPPQPPFWMQWWILAIVAVVIVAVAGAVYFLKKRKPQTTTPLPSEGTDIVSVTDK